MGQARITLPPDVHHLAEELMKLTGCSNISSLFGLMLTRYSGHLRQTWQVVTVEEAKPRRLEQFAMPAAELQSHSAKKHPEEEEDPAITRLAALIETF